MEQPCQLVDQILLVKVSGHHSVLVRKRSLHRLAFERAEKLGDRRYRPFPDIEIKERLDNCCQGPLLAFRADLPPSLFTATDPDGSDDK